MAQKQEPRYKVMSAGALGYGVYDTQSRQWANGHGYKNGSRKVVAEKCAQLNKTTKG